MTEIRVPTLGESVTEATIAKWFKAEGDSVAADEPLLELETDKVSVEVPAPAAGTLSEITAKDGETVEVGALLGQIAEGAGGAKPAPKAGAKADAPAANAKSEAPKSEAPKSEAPAGNGAAPSGGGTEVRVPSLGESVTEATVARIIKGEGESVGADEPLVELETDKVSVEVPAPTGGTIVSLAVKEGDTVEVGGLIGTISGSGAAAGAKPAPAKAAEAPKTSASSSEMPPAPSAKKAMAEAGLSPDQVQGTGKRGQILKGDVLGAIEGGATAPAAKAAPAQQSRAPSPAGDADREERVPMTRLRRTIAKRLKDAQDTAAMLTTFNDVDMSAVMDLRKQYKDVFEKKHSVKLGFMAFFAKACVHALKEVPAVNAEIDGNDLVYKNYYHMGIAVGTPKGLVVPVVKDCDQLGFADIEKTIADFGKRARDGQLKLDEMQGGTFTITNGGIYGSLMSTPILNAPQSGILGMHRIEQRPVAVGNEIKLRPMMYLALSYDHRIVDGKEAVTFLVRVKEAIEDPQRLLLDL
ncbi:2-oxoglutarate dehydrogenase complex dihydrolipoyllysine-residue succinyltransferase [Acuticoccus sp. I52.16.1]|uniref:2-oxoglutarate dehydrogenase complex dihydrolipoyllysine-residue succinyltransferase n=1 Tax=Acuticoccus sp. I52.16.1 TaxID=2928472 RepID=UPI001FD26CFC|nr:2-oxoglutarate dehydrogenase complex dihydrolipoyllysine-residue succinyltransferase [Acuticoccus sp. I52.16.1]UOM33409.1 2-oxoglutarate dehydrogenase complex dihydrolipoyllysine-residue succinyltransferase [Acuticoccus sp. I52.16.1]